MGNRLATETIPDSEAATPPPAAAAQGHHNLDSHPPLGHQAGQQGAMQTPPAEVFPGHRQADPRTPATQTSAALSPSLAPPTTTPLLRLSSGPSEPQVQPLSPPTAPHAPASNAERTHMNQTVHQQVPQPLTGLAPGGMQLPGMFYPARAMQSTPPSWHPALLQPHILAALLQQQQQLPQLQQLLLQQGALEAAGRLSNANGSGSAAARSIPSRPVGPPLTPAQTSVAASAPPLQPGSTSVLTTPQPAAAVGVAPPPNQLAQTDIGGALSRLNQTLASLDTRLQAPAPTGMPPPQQQAASLTAPTVNQGASFSNFAQSHLLYIKPLDSNTMVLSQLLARR